MGIERRNVRRAYYVLITFVAAVSAYVFFLWGHQWFFSDAGGYYDLAQRIARDGFFNVADDSRTYGYPLFLAIVQELTNHVSGTVRFAVFNAQLLIFLTTCLYAAKLFQAVFKRADLALAIYASTALNPFLLVYTTEVLTDLLSAVLIFLAISCSVRASRSQSRDAFLSFFLVALATMVRPVNATMIVVTAIIWAVRWIVYKNFAKRILLVMSLGLVIPFVPQLIINYKSFGKVQPLIVSSLYSSQTAWGMEYLKYGTLVLPGEPPTPLYYENPFFSSDISGPLDFGLKRPVEYAVTLGIHIFGMFDHDFLMTYIPEVHPWYRWPIALVNYFFLFVTGFGIFKWLRHWERQKQWNSEALVLGGMLTGAVFYVLPYVLVAVEDRFSLPAYLLLCGFFVYGLRAISGEFLNREWKQVGAIGTSLGVFVLGSMFLSNWLQAQAPMLSAHEIPPAHAQVISEAANTISKDGVVIVQKELIPSLVQAGLAPPVAERESFYELGANPCWGIADYLFADTTYSWYAYRKESWQHLFALGYFVPIFDHDGVILAKRATLEHSLHVQFGGQLDLMGYTLAPTRPLQGGDQLGMLLGWQGNGVSVEPYDVQMEVVDSRGHMWARGNRKPGDEVCPSNVWLSGKQVGDRFTFDLPPTMPAGDYQIRVALYDKNNERYLDVHDSSENAIGNSVLLTTVPVAKNKASFTASQLQIEYPYFVDMQEIRLMGYTSLPNQFSAGEQVHLGFYWRARAKPRGDYEVVVQLLDSSGAVVYAQSGRPVNDTYPTSLWDSGEVVLDWHDWTIPATLTSGDYAVKVLMTNSDGHALGEAFISILHIVGR